MKTFEQLEEELAIELGYDSAKEYLEEIRGTFYFEQRLRKFYNEVSKRYATEYAKEALKNASKGYTPAKIIYNGRTKGYDKVASVKDVLSENNLPDHE